MPRITLVIALLLCARVASADAPVDANPPVSPVVSAPDEPPPFTFGVALYDVYLHRQTYVRYVFNDQNSAQISQSSIAKRLEVEWRLRPTVGLVFGFQLPTRDEALRSGDVEIAHYHFPKSLSAGVLWNVSRVPLTKRGWLEFAVGGGVEEGLSDSPLQDLLPFVELNTRFAILSGSAMQVAFKYAGLVSRGQFAIVVGVAQRI